MSNLHNIVIFLLLIINSKETESLQCLTRRKRLIYSENENKINESAFKQHCVFSQKYVAQ